MQPRLKSLILALDALLAAPALAFTGERGTLLTFLFHSLFKSREEALSGSMDPQQGVTVEMLRQFIACLQRHSYEFIFPADIVDGLQPRGKYVLLTFDDGYYNNTRALPLLEEFGVPAVVYISSGHVKEGKAFWWDVVHREGKKRGHSAEQVHQTIRRYKGLKTLEVERDLQKQFGADALQPVGDLDRPLTPAELSDLAMNPLIALGNHTRDHAILTNYSVSEAMEQMQGAQDDIQEMTGKVPQSIAYPNGHASPEIVKAAEETGLQLGIGVRPGRNRVPEKGQVRDIMALKRFTLWGDRSIESQCRASRSAVSLYSLLYGLRGAM